MHPDCPPPLTGSGSQAVRLQLSLSPLQFPGFLLELLLFLQELCRGGVYRSLTRKGAVNTVMHQRDGWRVYSCFTQGSGRTKLNISPKMKVLKTMGKPNINSELNLKGSLPESYRSRSYGARWASSCWAESAKAPAEQRERGFRTPAEAGRQISCSCSH